MTLFFSLLCKKTIYLFRIFGSSGNCDLASAPLGETPWRLNCLEANPAVAFRGDCWDINIFDGLMKLAFTELRRWFDFAVWKPRVLSPYLECIVRGFSVDISSFLRASRWLFISLLYWGSSTLMPAWAVCLSLGGLKQADTESKPVIGSRGFSPPRVLFFIGIPGIAAPTDYGFRAPRGEDFTSLKGEFSLMNFLLWP